MEESIKNRIILILAIFALIFFISTLNSCGSAHRMKVARDKEIAARLELEKEMGKFNQEKAVFEKQLAQENIAHEAIKKTLAQEQLINQSLREELQKMTKLKDTLEEDLKEALVTGKAKKAKR
jgi:ABC-type transporter Mla maintaining outer membrane lipid asymmetry ATPase subunit MlaF